MTKEEETIRVIKIYDQAMNSTQTKPDEYKMGLFRNRIANITDDMWLMELEISEFLLECTDDTGKSPETMVKEAQELAKTIIETNK